MSKLRSAAAARFTALSLAALAGCSGGGSTAQSTPPTYLLSGTVRAAPATAADGDTHDAAAPVAPNDGSASAQQLPSLVTVGGWASATSDPDDWYRVTLAAGQTVTLEIADWVSPGTTPDLDLYLSPSVDPLNAVTWSETLSAREALSAPADGDYFVVVQALQGASNYVLRIGQAGATSVSVSAAGPDDLDPTAEFVPGEVIVTFRDVPGALAASPQARAASVGLEAVAGAPGREQLLAIGTGPGRARALAALGIPDDPAAAAADPVEQRRRDTLAAVRALRARPDVALADPNYIRRAARVPNDTYYGLQWHYPLINLPQAWDVTTGASSVVVAVVDTGVLLGHPDLATKLQPGYDFVSDPTSSRDGGGIDPDPTDPGTSPNPGQSSWHGTHVAATIGANTDNGLGVAGVGWNTTILPIRVLGLNGSGTGFDIMQGVQWAAGIIDAPGRPAASGPRAQIINLSLGGPSFSASEQAVYDAVRAKGVLVVAAAGNNNSSALFYPASYDGVISVSAVDMLGNKAPYSNFGPKVDVAAPGGDASVDLDANGYPDGVLSAIGYDATGTLQYTYGFLQGTSQATPHVAGVLALMKAVCSNLTPAAVDDLISQGKITTHLGPPGRDDVYGYGLIDALAAVQEAQSACSLPPGTTFDVAPTRLDFQPAPATTVLSVRVTKQGPGALAPVTASGNAPWLAVFPASVDAEGVGTWTARVTRPAAAGVYSGAITFTSGGGGGQAVIVPVTMQVGSAGVAADAGFTYVLLVDADKLRTDPANAVLGQVAKGATGGAYAFTFANVPGGGTRRYYLIAGTDADGDGTICDAGESCGAYPTLAQPVAIDPTAANGSLDFLVGFSAGLGAAAADPGSGFAVPPGGFRLLRRGNGQP